MRRKLVAVILSGLACPGAGQIYNRQRAKGAILIIATLAVLAAVFYVAWNAAIEIALTTPPDKMLEDISGLAKRIAEANKVFYDRATLAFLAIWAYGVVDAYMCADKADPAKQG